MVTSSVQSTELGSQTGFLPCTGCPPGMPTGLFGMKELLLSQPPSLASASVSLACMG